MSDQHVIVFGVAGIVFSIHSDQPINTIRLGPAYRDFVCTGEPDVTIHARYGRLPRISLRDEDLVFDSAMVWSLYQVDSRYIFALRSPISGAPPYCMAIFDSDWRQGEVYTRTRESCPEDGLLPNPLEFPLSEALMVCLLARGHGLMVHACGIDDGGRGYLFTGNSTHGKTTMARLWRERALVLNDDRIVLRWHEGRFWMYGTPWHGEYSSVSPQGVLLDKVFFLRYATMNRVYRHQGIDAASMLLARCFLPLWDAAGIAFTLDFCSKLAEVVPCWELGFVSDKSVVDFVRCVR